MAVGQRERSETRNGAECTGAGADKLVKAKERAGRVETKERKEEYGCSCH